MRRLDDASPSARRKPSSSSSGQIAWRWRKTSKMRIAICWYAQRQLFSPHHHHRLCALVVVCAYVLKAKINSSSQSNSSCSLCMRTLFAARTIMWRRGANGEWWRKKRVKYFERLAEETPQPSPLHPRVHVVVKIRKMKNYNYNSEASDFFAFSSLFTVLQPPFHLHSSSYASFSPLFAALHFLASVHSLLIFYCIFTCATGLAEIRFYTFAAVHFCFYFGRCCGHFHIGIAAEWWSASVRLEFRISSSSEFTLSAFKVRFSPQQQQQMELFSQTFKTVDGIMKAFELCLSCPYSSVGHIRGEWTMKMKRW